MPRENLLIIDYHLGFRGCIYAPILVHRNIGKTQRTQLSPEMEQYKENIRNRTTEVILSSVGMPDFIDSLTVINLPSASQRLDDQDFWIYMLYKHWHSPNKLQFNLPGGEIVLACCMIYPKQTLDTYRDVVNDICAKKKDSYYLCIECLLYGEKCDPFLFDLDNFTTHRNKSHSFLTFNSSYVGSNSDCIVTFDFKIRGLKLLGQLTEKIVDFQTEYPWFLMQPLYTRNKLFSATITVRPYNGIKINHNFALNNKTLLQQNECNENLMPASKVKSSAKRKKDNSICHNALSVEEPKEVAKDQDDNVKTVQLNFVIQRVIEDSYTKKKPVNGIARKKSIGGHTDNEQNNCSSKPGYEERVVVKAAENRIYFESDGDLYDLVTKDNFVNMTFDQLKDKGITTKDVQSNVRPNNHQSSVHGSKMPLPKSNQTSVIVSHKSPKEISDDNVEMLDASIDVGAVLEKLRVTVMTIVLPQVRYSRCFNVTNPSFFKKVLRDVLKAKQSKWKMTKDLMEKETQMDLIVQTQTEYSVATKEKMLTGCHLPPQYLQQIVEKLIGYVDAISGEFPRLPYLINQPSAIKVLDTVLQCELEEVY